MNRSGLLAALGRLLSHLDPTLTGFSPETVHEVLEAYRRVKSQRGSNWISSCLGLSAHQLRAFEFDLRYAGRHEASIGRKDRPDRNRELAEWSTLGWLEDFQSSGIDLGLKEEVATDAEDLRGLRQVRAIEQILREVVRDRAEELASLEAELRSTLGDKVVDVWRSQAGKGDLLEGTTFSELGSLIAAKSRFEQYEGLFRASEVLDLCGTQRRTLLRFLDDIRRIRNILAHGRRVTRAQLEALDRQFEEIVGPLQESFDEGRTGVDPSTFMADSVEELRSWSAGLEDAVGEIHEGLDGLRSEVTARLEALRAKTERLETGVSSTRRRSAVILCVAALTLVGVLAVLKDSAATQEGLEGLTQQGDEVLTGVESLSRSVQRLATLGGLIPAPASASEWIHNARIHRDAGRYGAALDSYEKALRGQAQPLDLISEAADAMRAVDGNELALARALQWADPTGTRYSILAGSPVRSRDAAAEVGPTPWTELLVASMLPAPSDRLAWLEPLLATEAPTCEVAVMALETVAALPLQERPRTAFQLARRSLEVLQPCEPLAVESCFLDAAGARLARTRCEQLRDDVRELGDLYWSGTPLVDCDGTFDYCTVRVYVPDRHARLQVQVRGRTLEEATWVPSALPTGGSGGGEDSLPAAWSGAALTLSYGEGPEELMVDWLPAEEEIAPDWNLTVDTLAACVSFFRRQIEQGYTINIGSTDEPLLVEEHVPGRRAIRAEFLSLDQPPSFARIQALRTELLETWGAEEHGGREACAYPQFRCAIADPAMAGFACGGGRPILAVQCPPSNLPGPATVDLTPLMENRRALDAIHYSVGTTEYSQTLEFAFEDHRAAWRVDGDRQLIAASGGEPISEFGNAITIADRFDGPLHLRLTYKDGSRSEFQVDLVDLYHPPEGWPEQPLRPPEATPPAGWVVPRGATVVRDLDPTGRRRVWVGRPALSVDDKSRGLLQHGVSVTTDSETGEQVELMAYDDVPVVAIRRRRDGGLRTCDVYYPLWERGDDAPMSFAPHPSRWVAVGPYFELGDKGPLFDPLWINGLPAWPRGGPDVPPSLRFEPSHRPMTDEEWQRWSAMPSLGACLAEGVLQNYLDAPCLAWTIGHMKIRAAILERPQLHAFFLPPDKSLGPVVGDRPVGLWTDYRDGVPVAQGWVHDPSHDDEPCAGSHRVGRWTYFDENGLPVGFADFNEHGRIDAYVARFDGTGALSEALIADEMSTGPYIVWRDEAVRFSNGDLDAELIEWHLEQIRESRPSVGPITWPMEAVPVPK